MQRQQPHRAQLEGLILRTLLAELPTKKWLTTTEIAAALNRRFDMAKSKNNVSRYFNQEFHPYYELRFRERDGKRNGALEYRLSATGISRAKQMHVAPEGREMRTRRRQRAEHVQMSLVWCLRSKHQIIETAARATDAKMESALLCHTKGLGS